MTASFHDWGIRVGGFFFVGVDFAVVFGVEGAVCSIDLFGRHGEDEAVLLAFESGSVIAAVRIDHALGERSGMYEFGQRGGEAIILLMEPAVGADVHAHVGEGGRFGVRASGVAGKFWLIGAGRSLSGLSRSHRRESRRDECESGDNCEYASERFSHSESSPEIGRQEFRLPGRLSEGVSAFFFMLLP